MNQEDIYTPEERSLLSDCTLCPRECRADRFKGGSGYCRCDSGMNVASVCVHRGEEPVISAKDGICNVFFSGCNLRCIYCQNHEISRPDRAASGRIDGLTSVVNSIQSILEKGIRSVGFVSPSHNIPQMLGIIRELKNRGLSPLIIYNTNSYDKPEVIDSLDGLVDVYLPDIKYVTPEIALRFSDAFNYPDIAIMALKRMYYQKGSVLQTDNEGRAVNGILIRHLVLPGYAEESMAVLRIIADEVSTGVSISLMSQYHPTRFVTAHPDLGRNLYRREYEAVAYEMEKLGFRNGWLQEMESNTSYRPDFSKDHPFE